MSQGVLQLFRTYMGEEIQTFSSSVSVEKPNVFIVRKIVTQIFSGYRLASYQYQPTPVLKDIFAAIWAVP